MMSAAGPELPSLEDVVRQHFGARREAPVQDPALRCAQPLLQDTLWL